MPSSAEVFAEQKRAQRAARDAANVSPQLAEEAAALLYALDEAVANLDSVAGVASGGDPAQGGLASFAKLRKTSDYVDGLGSAAAKQRAAKGRLAHQATP